MKDLAGLNRRDVLVALSALMAVGSVPSEAEGVGQAKAVQGCRGSRCCRGRGPGSTTSCGEAFR